MKIKIEKARIYSVIKRSYTNKNGETKTFFSFGISNQETKDKQLFGSYFGDIDISDKRHLTNIEAVLKINSWTDKKTGLEIQRPNIMIEKFDSGENELKSIDESPLMDGVIEKYE